MNKPEKKEDLRPYRVFGMPLLVVMALLAAIGIIGSLILHFFFNAI